MKRIIAFTIAALLATPAPAQQAPARLEDFAWRGAISVSGAGPFHQVVLPLEVYKGIVSASLNDLRVFNGQGEALPYALLRGGRQSAPQTTEVTAPFFPLRSLPGDAASQPGMGGAGDVSVTVRQNADGTLVSVQQQPSKTEAGDVVKGVVVDASAVKGSIRSLRLVAETDAAAFHLYTIESSRDLQQWRVLKQEAQLAHLEHAGHRVDIDSAEWDSAADRYLRLIWRNPRQAPEIKSVTLNAAESNRVPLVRVWSEDIAPSAVKPNVYEYTLPGQMPVEKVRINLPQANTLAPLDVQYVVSNRWGLQGREQHDRRDQSQRWQTLAHTVAYRLSGPQGEVRSGDVAAYGNALSALRLAVDSRGGGVGSIPPTIQVGFEPHVLVFLGRGDGPFVLAWGAEDVAPAGLTPSTLIPDYDSAAPLKAAPASLAASDIVQVKPAAQAGKSGPDASHGANKWVLWAVLIAGLLVLGGMARSLVRQLRQPPK